MYTLNLLLINHSSSTVILCVCVIIFVPCGVVWCVSYILFYAQCHVQNGVSVYIKLYAYGVVLLV